MTQSNVLNLETERPVPVPVCPEVIERLEELLERARKGEINGIVFATIHSPGAGRYLGVASGWAGDACRSNVHTVAGAIQMVQMRWHKEFIE